MKAEAGNETEKLSGKRTAAVPVLVALAAVTVFASCAGAIISPRRGGAQDASKSAPTDADRAFIRHALESGNTEIHLGQLAGQKAASGDVKEFAQKMIDDHEALNAQIQPAGQRLGIQPTDEISSEGSRQEDRLKGLSGSRFDDAYIRVMVQDHREDLQAFRVEAAQGHDAAVKEAAKHGGDLLSQHLRMIYQIAQAHHVPVDAPPAEAQSR
ncbi:DUF4142 domain-containing protein [Paracidobacterium acidisoli]|uniref:DUF4142 domain-containing protein n=1 Tax=Paracidobacterium acidisoli TaxID=2303751 RepID=A0A372IRH7_9BACT|nr:DUF4142 domain-containing protein [Paracidobacterium acidisoli]MBT9330376.1 DUF4142 domain-containing protein [Paracidobacterium acidisoli]